MKKRISWLLLVCLVPCLSGCLTRKLWDEYPIDHYFASPNAELQLFHSADSTDVLVSYNEEHDNNAVVRRRSYYLFANLEKLNARHKPNFIIVPIPANLQPIPIDLEPTTNINSIGETGMWASFSPYTRSFRLFSEKGEIGAYPLPSYTSFRSECGRLALMPLALTGDVVICASVVGAVAGYRIGGRVPRGCTSNFTIPKTPPESPSHRSAKSPPTAVRQSAACRRSPD